jgi:hypothetical protein
MNARTVSAAVSSVARRRRRASAQLATAPVPVPLSSIRQPASSGSRGTNSASSASGSRTSRRPRVNAAMQRADDRLVFANGVAIRAVAQTDRVPIVVACLHLRLESERDQRRLERFLACGAVAQGELSSDLSAGGLNCPQPARARSHRAREPTAKISVGARRLPSPAAHRVRSSMHHAVVHGPDERGRARPDQPSPGDRGVPAPRWGAGRGARRAPPSPPAARARRVARTAALWSAERAHRRVTWPAAGRSQRHRSLQSPTV